MELCTQMVLIKKSGFAATNAKTLTTWNVLHLKRKKTLGSLSCVGLLSVGDRVNCKQVSVDLGLDLKLVIKQVTFSFLVARQKTTKKEGETRQGWQNYRREEEGKCWLQDERAAVENIGPGQGF